MYIYIYVYLWACLCVYTFTCAYVYVYFVYICVYINVKAVLFQTIQFSISTISMSKTVPFQIIRLCNKYTAWLPGFLRWHLIFYHLGFSDYCFHLYCYFYYVSADMSSGLLQVFVELGNLRGNFELRPSLNPRRSPVLIPWCITGYKVLTIPVLLLACCQDWTCKPLYDCLLRSSRNQRVKLSCLK